MVYKTTQLNIGCWLFFLFIQFSYGLDHNQSWTSIGIETKLPYSLKLEFEQELRLKDQLTAFHQSFSEVSLSYKVFDGLNIKIPYRYAFFDKKIKQRLSLGGSYKYSVKTINLKYRTRFQRSFEKDMAPEDLTRNKFTIEYKLGKKIEPYVSWELFHLYNTNNDQYDEYRVSFGFSLDLPGKNSIKFFYIFKKEDIAKSNPDEINVFGMSYRFKL